MATKLILANVETLIKHIQDGDFDINLQELAQALFNRKKDLAGLPRRKIKLIDTVDVDNTAVSKPTNPPYPHKGYNTTKVIVPTPIVEVKPLLPTQIKTLAPTSMFQYNGKSYLKNEVRGKEFLLPKNISPAYLSNIKVVIVGVNQKLKIQLLESPKSGTKGASVYKTKGDAYVSLSCIDKFLK